MAWLWKPVVLGLIVTILMVLGAASLVKDFNRLKSYAGTKHLSVDLLLVDCPADPAYSEASQCIRTGRGVEVLVVDDNGVARTVPVADLERAR